MRHTYKIEQVADAELGTAGNRYTYILNHGRHVGCFCWHGRRLVKVDRPCSCRCLIEGNLWKTDRAQMKVRRFPFQDTVCNMTVAYALDTKYSPYARATLASYECLSMRLPQITCSGPYILTPLNKSSSSSVFSVGSRVCHLYRPCPCTRRDTFT